VPITDRSSIHADLSDKGNKPNTGRGRFRLVAENQSTINATDWADGTQRASGELAAALIAVTPDEIDRMADEILTARQIVCSGVGREGLMVRALCMRLMHLGLDAHMAFDMTTPRVGAGDLLVVSSGPGQPGTLAALTSRARGDGANPGGDGTTR
jgi:6-phospho-3-hexuloisomerase